jgi:hypothetical protein
MSAKKKTRKKDPKSKRAAGNKTRLMKKKLATRKQTARKHLSKKNGPQKKATMNKRTSAGEQTAARKAASAGKKRTRKRNRTAGKAFSREGFGAHPGGQAGDLQGLSRVEGADSESVDELVEEGNAFEADVVAGVENADDADEKEVRTHEVPEDDVPDEYVDKDL